MNTAAWNGELKMVKMLVEAGADPNGMPNNPPLGSAAFRGYSRVVQYLLAQPEIEVDQQDIDGLTALWCAAKNGSVWMVDMLLEAGADPSIKRERGGTPEDEAREKIDKFEAVIKRLGRNAEQDDQAAADRAPAAESRFDETKRFIFHSILEGLYEDGVSTEDVERILMRREDEEYFHFIYACPVCMASVWAFDAYRLRPERLHFVKSGASTFGFGLEKEISEALHSDDVKRRLSVINTLIERWIDRRMDTLRLTKEERAELAERLEEKREEGLARLNQFRAGSSVALYATAYLGQDEWECAVCRAAVGKPMEFGEAAIDFYSPDASHVWNRLYAGLFVRTAGDQVFDDWMDPIFSRETIHFLSGESNAKTLALLAEFAKDRDAHEGATPLQRAVMQRDLLAMFHWARHAKQTPGKDQLIKALVGAIRHVALTADEINKLPDNYAIAAGLPAAHTTYDAAEPNRAFLPKDLLVDDGPWLALEPRQDRPLAAPVHFQIFGERSAFDLHFRHPEGRAAGERYLDELATMPNPFLAEKPATPVPGINRETGPWLNPDTPQFPPGTMWALVRRAILVDVEGSLIVSPLVESVEMRVYRALADTKSNREAQTFFEWELSRRLLFGKGGFHLMDGRDLSLSPFFPHADKIATFAKHSAGEPLACFACHSAPGIHSVNSRTLHFFTGDFDYEPKGTPKRPSEFRSTTRKRLAEVTEQVAAKQKSWQEFRKVWDEK